MRCIEFTCLAKGSLSHIEAPPASFVVIWRYSVQFVFRIAQSSGMESEQNKYALRILQWKWLHHSHRKVHTSATQFHWEQFPILRALVYFLFQTCLRLVWLRLVWLRSLLFTFCVRFPPTIPIPARTSAISSAAFASANPVPFLKASISPCKATSRINVPDIPERFVLEDFLSLPTLTIITGSTFVLLSYFLNSSVKLATRSLPTYVFFECI